MPARKITFLSTGLALGGAETQVALLAHGLKRRGWRVQVISMLPPAAFEEQLAQVGVPVHCLDMRPGFCDPRAVITLAGHLRRIRPHILHCHMVHANILGRITRLIAPVPLLISTAHNIYEGPPWRDWWYRLTDSLSDLTTNVSRAGLDRYVRESMVREDKGIFVPNGIDTSRFAPDSSARAATRSQLGWGDSFVWLAVGNMREAKDYPTMLRAFANLSSRRRNMVLAIAGIGDFKGALHAQAQELGIVESVRFLGQRMDIQQLMQSADAYLMSSAWEGMPLVLLEASASGLPIVATLVGGNADVVERGKTGLLVPPRDPGSLADSMLRMMELTPVQRATMGMAARSRVENIYGHERVLDRWENIYQQLLENGSRKSMQHSSFAWRNWLWKKP